MLRAKILIGTGREEGKQIGLQTGTGTVIGTETATEIGERQQPATEAPSPGAIHLAMLPQAGVTGAQSRGKIVTG